MAVWSDVTICHEHSNHGDFQGRCSPAAALIDRSEIELQMLQDWHDNYRTLADVNPDNPLLQGGLAENEAEGASDCCEW